MCVVVKLVVWRTRQEKNDDDMFNVASLCGANSTLLTD